MRLFVARSLRYAIFALAMHALMPRSRTLCCTSVKLDAHFRIECSSHARRFVNFLRCVARLQALIA